MRSLSRTCDTFKIYRDLTGLQRHQLAGMIIELAPPWEVAAEGVRERRRGHAVSCGGGRRYELVFADRVVVTLTHLRHGLTQELLAGLFQVHRATIGRAIAEIRPLLAVRGIEVEQGVRLRTLADVFAYLEATDQIGCLDGTDIRVRRPQAHKPGRKAYISGKHRRNTIKLTVITDKSGRLLFCGAARPGRMHDQTAVKSEGIDDLFDQHPDVILLVDAGYRGLVKDHPNQAIGPPPKPGKHATPDELATREQTRHDQSSARIPVEHGNAHLKIAHSLNRWYGPRRDLPETAQAWAAVLTYRQRNP